MSRNAAIGFGAAALVVILLVGWLVGRAWPEMAAFDADEARARQGVIAIVDQPITHLARTSEAAQFSPGWFHPGAIKPDFNTVDVRQTQELIYANDTFVTSDVNPNEMFMGRELEFNAMTKYLYTDRSLPKKRLSEAEMLEINQFYRVIGHDEAALAKPRGAIAGAVLLALLVVGAPFAFLRRPVAEGA